MKGSFCGRMITEAEPEENAKTKTLDSDRIRQLHETIGEMAEKITRLEKEKKTRC